MTDPHWTQYLSALLTPVVAGFGIYIAWRQAQTARRKLKLELFAKRFAVYEAARALVFQVFIKGGVSSEAMGAYMLGTSEARWLLDESVNTYLRKSLLRKAVDLQDLSADLEGLPVGAERSQKVRARDEIKDWFKQQDDVLIAFFSPYLRLEH